MLVGKEQPPPVREAPGGGSAEQAIGGRVAVRLVDARDLVIALVVEAGARAAPIAESMVAEGSRPSAMTLTGCSPLA